MREIKFRAWDKEEKNMRTLEETNKLGGLRIWSTNLTTDDDFVLMQYTGRMDKNGKEIYVGDIILIKPDMVGSPIGTIKWSDKRFRFEFNNGNHWSFIEIPPTSKHTIEVLGNIYENPELLER